jgi:hypothetical protein
MSRDGLAWQFLQYEGRKLYIDDALDAGGRTFVVSGGEIFDVASRDGSALTKIDAPPAPVSKMVYWDGRLFGACEDGSIRELSPLNFLRTSYVGARLRLDASGLAGQRVRIDSSADMVSWLEGSTVLTLPVTWEVSDTSAAQRFYRATILE